MAEPTGFFDYLRGYAAAMPRAYRLRYDAYCIADHARVAYRRGERKLAASVCRGPSHLGTPLCIVGSNRAVVLSALSRSAVLTHSDVTAAEAYTLDHRLGLRAVIGLFWVQRAGGKGRLDEHEGALLAELLEAVGNQDPLARRATLGHLKRLDRVAPDTRVRFLEGLDGTLSALEVETTVRSGLLPTLVDVLTAERVQIVHCEIQARADRVCDRLRLLDHDGGSLEPSRWRQIQVRVLEAIGHAADLRALTA